MTTLGGWLEHATRDLSNDSASQVRNEIREHYEFARESALARGANSDCADALAVADLGNPKRANREYHKVLLTRGEARLLGEGNWEARGLCSRRAPKWLLAAVPATALMAAIAEFLRGAAELASILLLGSLLLAVLFSAPFLPVYTPARGRLFRGMKWIMMLGTLALAFRTEPWLLFACLWPLAWVEWTRISIRRKLPVARWPKQLYL